MALEQLELERLGKDGKPAYGTGTFPGREKYQQDFLKMASAIRENTSEQGNMMKAIDKNFDSVKKELESNTTEITFVKTQMDHFDNQIAGLKGSLEGIKDGFKSDVAQLALNVHRFQKLIYVLIGIIGLIAIIGLFV